uniref:M20_dimer domain-containing protein n=1 Tax=Meloidogyne hapla TaxID=6305 RepID=A0A1I8BKJ6_MELHA
MSAEDKIHDTIFKYIESNKNLWIERLREAVAIPSVSATAEHRQDMMKKLGIICKQIENSNQTLPDGTTIPLPPVLFGTLGNDKKKKTLLIYGHLDVQPANFDDGWNTEPFELTEIDGKLFGRGSTDDKGPVLGWLNVIETLQKLGIEIPINLKFCFEGMEESGSLGLDAILNKYKKEFLEDIDFTCISDNYWLGKEKPCITYGLRGICSYQVEVTSPKQDLHSGTYGGAIHEPMIDLCWLLSQLTDNNGNILINGLDKMVAELTKEESEEAFQKDIGVGKLTSTNPKEILMRRWRQPSLSVHGIEGAFYGKGTKTVIPAKVIGKFSIRVIPSGGALAWLGDFRHAHYKAGANAVKKVYGVEPDFTREGGSIPVTLTFQDITGKNVMLLPMGRSDDMAHSQAFF